MTQPLNILVVDDEPSICWGFDRLLRDEGYNVYIASSSEAGLKLAKEHCISLVLLDIRLPGEDGLSALPKFSSATDNAPIVVMTAFGDLETAVRAVQLGAADYLTKPFPLEHAASTCRQAIKRAKVSPSQSGDVDFALPMTGSLVGASPAMQQVFRQIANVAGSPLSVLITGETGTGKELVAAAIHRHSSRAEKPYLTVAPVSFSESLFESELFGHVRGAFTGATEDRQGLFELANGGTVLLDEIGDLPVAAQAKLLRVIDQQQYTRVGDLRSRQCDVRIIAATHRNLVDAASDGRFREDLYYRLAAVRIHLPPLRERAGDISILCTHFLQRIGHPLAALPLDEQLVSELQMRPWYGNVRELRNSVEHAAVFARNRPLTIADFPVSQANQLAAKEGIETRLASVVQEWTHSKLEGADGESSELYQRFLTATEPAMLQVLLQKLGGNRAAIADRLKIDRGTLRERLKRYGLDEQG